MSMVECRFADILLNNVLNLILVNLTVIQFLTLLLSCWKAVELCRLDALLDFQVFVHVFAVVFLILVKLDAQLLDLAHNENTLAL